jgi:hypothetical protein
MIINLRGCNGSGKTTIVRRFLDRLPSRAFGPRADRPLGYGVDATEWGVTRPVYVVGSYENACGGADVDPRRAAAEAEAAWGAWGAEALERQQQEQPV